MSKVAVIPLAKFTSEADHKLVADLATSVERTAVVKHLRKLADDTHLESFDRAFRIAADHIEAGLHEV